MNRVLVLVEGQTEEAFVGKSLRPHLWALGVDLAPKVIVTRRVASGPDRKGGVTSWQQIERDLKLLLGDTSVVAITTFLDYYGLPTDVPGLAKRPNGTVYEKVQHIQRAINDEVGDARMHSYLALHEFEALIFTDPDLCGGYLSSPHLTAMMRAALVDCGQPELVNDDPAKAPSKRILAAYPTYQKTFHGPALVDQIGLAALRSACPHFCSWLDWLESLGS